MTRRLSFALIGSVMMVGPLYSVSAFEIDMRQSPGGIEYQLIRMPDATRVALHVAWPDRWAYDDRAVATPYLGAELILNGGAGELAAPDVLERFADLQAEGDLFSEADHLRGWLDAPAPTFDDVVALSATILARPHLDRRWFDRLQGDMRARIEENSRQSLDRVLDLSRRLVLGDQAVERFLSLAPPTLVENVTLEHVKRWHRQTLVRSDLVVALAGAIDAAAAGEAVDALFEALPEGESLEPANTPVVDFSPRTVLLHDPEVSKSSVSLLGAVPAASEGHELEDELIAQLLGGGETSRLFRALRTELRASYTVFADVGNPTRQLGGVFVFAEIDTSKLKQARALMREVYANFRKNGPEPEELGAAKKQLSSALKDWLETPANLAATAVNSALDGHPPKRLVKLFETLEAISVDSIRKHLHAHYPTADELIEITLSNRLDGFDGACVITTIDEASTC